MRLASVLLVLTLLTTCMTAGTFAKYVTEANGSKTARVAKFGVEVSVDAGTVFGENYASQNNGNGVVEDGNGATVSANEMVVAPGTKGSMTFSIKGTPETAVNLNISLGEAGTEMQEVMLKAGTYKDFTNDKGSTFIITDQGYYPVKWTLKNNDAVVETTNSEKLENVSLTKINEYFKSISKNYDANTNLTTALGGNTETYTLSWVWNIDENNPADTLLGQLANDESILGKQDTNGNNFIVLTKDDYNLTEAFNFKISVEQVD